MSDHSAMQPYRIVIADDHSLIRQGIKSIIRTDPSLQIIGEAGNGLELLALLDTEVPDMVILDLTMPRLSGLEAIERISRTLPGVAILVLSMHGGSHSFYRAIAAGQVLRGDGSAQAQPLREALVSRDRKQVFRIDDGIPVLLAEEALATAQVADFPAG